MPLTPAARPPAMDPDLAGDSLDLLISHLEDTLVAVEIGYVQQIADLAAPHPGLPPAEERLDVAALWGIRTGAAGERRAVVVTTARGPRWLVLGPTVRVVPVLAATVQPTPPFVAGLAAAAGIRAILVEERIGFVVDVDGLVTLYEGGVGHE